MKKSTQLSATKNELSKPVEIQVPDSDGNFHSIAVQKDELAHSNNQFMKGLVRLVLHTRQGGKQNEIRVELNLMKMMFQEHGVTAEEAYEGFKQAYSDQYTPQSGVSWRHIYKHIEEMRKGVDRKLYTYGEMLRICDKEEISTDTFEHVKEVFDKVREKSPEKDLTSIRCWKRI